MMTFAFALLTVAGGAAALLTLVHGTRHLAALTAGGLAVGLLAAAGAAMVGAALAHVGRDLRRRGRRRPAWWLALAVGWLPMAVMIAVQHVVFQLWLTGGMGQSGAREWLIGCCMATFPWVVVAGAGAGHQRTLRGIHAYAAHLIFVLLTVARLVCGATVPVALVVMIVAAMPPALVGMLIAQADRHVLPSTLMQRRRRVAGRGHRR